MTYCQFVQAVEKHVKETAREEIRITVHTSQKNNGVCRRGLLFSEEQTNISPAIYLEEYYRRFELGYPVEEIAKELGLTDVEIIENNVDITKPGDYGVTFEGTNAQKEQEIHSIKVMVTTATSGNNDDNSSSANKPSGESVETGLTSGATITLGGVFTLAGIPFLKRKRK